MLYLFNKELYFLPKNDRHLVFWQFIGFRGYIIFFMTLRYHSDIFYGAKTLRKHQLIRFSLRYYYSQRASGTNRHIYRVA